MNIINRLKRWWFGEPTRIESKDIISHDVIKEVNKLKEELCQMAKAREDLLNGLSTYSIRTRGCMDYSIAKGNKLKFIESTGQTLIYGNNDELIAVAPIECIVTKDCFN